MRTTAIAIARTTAMMTMASNMAGSVSLNGKSGKSAAEGYQRAQVPVAQPQPAPHHQAEIEPEQSVAEQRAADPKVRRDCASEIAGQQDRAQDRGRRHSIEHGAHN